MAKLTHGPVTVVFDDALTLSDKAGKLTPEDILRLPKSPAGVGLAAHLTADALTAAGDAFTAPKGVTPKSLLAAASRAEGYDSLIVALDVVRQTIQEENLLADAACWDQLRQINDMLKGQVRHHPELAAMFAPLTAFMAKSAVRGKKAVAPGPGQA